MWEAACRLHANTVLFYMRDIASAGLGICGISGNPVFLCGFLAYPPMNKGTVWVNTEESKRGAPDFPFLFEKKNHNDMMGTICHCFA